MENFAVKIKWDTIKGLHRCDFWTESVRPPPRLVLARSIAICSGQVHVQAGRWRAAAEAWAERKIGER